MHLCLAFFLWFWTLNVFLSSVCRAAVTACLLLFRMSSRWCSINTSVAAKINNIHTFLFDCSGKLEERLPTGDEFWEYACCCTFSPMRSVSWEVKGSLCCKKKKSRRLCCTVGRFDSCSGLSQLSFSTVYTVPPLYTRSAGDVEIFMPK